jgi:sporulation protein YlmC with PRC-barrel domain
VKAVSRRVSNVSAFNISDRCLRLSLVPIASSDAKHTQVFCILETVVFQVTWPNDRQTTFFQEEVMARYGTLGDYRFGDTKEAATDIRGSKVYGPQDEKLGEIDDVIFDEATGGIAFVVVDTGGWLSSKKFIVPPEEIRPSVQHEDDFLVNLTKQQIESFPPYDGKALTSEEKWSDYERRYRSKWVERPIMHREATDRNITPTTKQQMGSPSGAPDAAGDTAEIDTSAVVAPVHNEAFMDASPAGPSMRWTAFEDTLRQRRQEVLQSSIDNAKRASGETATDRQQRKAS